MIKFVVVFKTVIARVIWRININQLHFAFKLFGKRMQGNQIIAFDNEIFGWCAVWMAFDFANRLFAVCGVAGEFWECFCVKKSVNFIKSKCLIKKDFLSFLG